MKKKKKGSSLIMVLAMAAIFTMISGVVATAVVSTTKANSAEKHWEDMLYTCEAGVERALVDGRNGGFSGLTSYGSSKIITIPKEEFPNLNIAVNVTVTKSGDLKFPEEEYNSLTNPTVNSYYLIESTSTYADRTSRTVKARMNAISGGGQPNTGNDIFNNGMVAGQDKISVSGSGSFDLSTSNINSPSSAEINVEGSKAGPASETNNVYNTLDFIPQFKKYDSVKVNSLGQLKSNFEDGNGNNVPTTNLQAYVDDYSKEIGEIPGVGYFKVKNLWQIEYTIYIINTDNFTIEINDRDSIDKSIFITNGEINLKAVPEAPNKGFALHATWSTLYGKGIYVEENGAITMQYQPKGDTAHHLSEDNIVELDKHIKRFIINWGSADGGSEGGGGGSTEGGVSLPGDYEY